MNQPIPNRSIPHNARVVLPRLSHRDVLARLFPNGSTTGPSVDAESFLGDHYPHKHVVTHGNPARLGELPFLDIWSDLPELLAQNRSSARPTAFAQDRETGAASSRQVTSEEAAAAFRQGESVAIEDGDLVHPLINRWARVLARALGVASSCVKPLVVLSPEGPSVPMHADPFDVLVIQLRGEKTWLHEVEDDPACDGPESGLRSTRGRALRETHLEPGSVMFLPRGRMHATSTVATSVSVSFRIKVDPAHQVLADAIAAVLARHADWRRPVPGAFGDRWWRARAAATIDDLLPRLSRDLRLERGAAALLSHLTGPRFVRSDGVTLEARTSELVVLKSGVVQRRVRVDEDLLEIAPWLNAQVSPFCKDDLADASGGGVSGAAVSALLAWLERAGVVSRQTMSG